MRTSPPMSDKLYLIRFKGLELSFRAVRKHLVFLRPGGRLAALFFLEIVENWSEFELYNARHSCLVFCCRDWISVFSQSLRQPNSFGQSNSHDGNTSDVFYFFSISPASAGNG
jgi:hypothetical protein